MASQDVCLTDEAVPAGKPSLVNRPLMMLFLSAIAGMLSIYLLLATVPLYAAGDDDGGLAAGVSMGTMMLGTVLLELAVPTLLARYGYRVAMALALLLIGLPALPLAVSPAMPLVVIVCLARGAGLGIAVVALTALVAEAAPSERRSEALAIYGFIVGVPAVTGLPLGVWLSDKAGFGLVFVASTVIATLGLAAVPGLPRVEAHVQRETGVLGGLRQGPLSRPTVVFAAFTIAAGVLVTFVPLALRDSPSLAAAALLAQSATTPVARWAAGRYGDRHGSGPLVMPSVLVAALGATMFIWYESPAAVIIGAGLYGVGYGVAQNATLAVMFQRVPRSEFGRVSALWNLAFDAGMGIGAVGFGLAITPLGYPAAFALTALILLAAVIPAWLDRRPPTPTG